MGKCDDAAQPSSDVDELPGSHNAPEDVKEVAAWLVLNTTAEPDWHWGVGSTRVQPGLNRKAGIKKLVMCLFVCLV